MDEMTEAFLSENERWQWNMRVGRRLGRTLYLHDVTRGADQESDVVIGMVDSKELAEEICRRWNAAL